MSVLILDAETTDRDEPEIIEVAWIRLKSGADLLGADPDLIWQPLEEAAYFEQRYRPSKSVTFGSLAVHHILPSELEGCPLSSSFALPSNTAYLVGHSIDFDWKAIGSPANVKRICTCAMARALWPKADSHSQSALLYMLLGPTAETREMLRGAHGAAVDVTNNLILLERILKEKPEITTWSGLWAFSEEARIPTVMPIGRNRGAPITELETSEMHWYLDRDFIEPYLRKAFEKEIKRRSGGSNEEGGEETGDEEETAE